MSKVPGRSWKRGQITPPELLAVVHEVATGRHAGRSVRRVAERLVEQSRTEALEVDLVVHDGDLTLRSLHTGRAPWLGLLVVRGDLEVAGLYHDWMDPEAVVIVTGDLHAQRLVSSAFLEVHGSVTVETDCIWRDNDGCAEIMGDLRAGFVYTKYHSVRVHGRVVAPLVLGDARHVVAGRPYLFVGETDARHKAALRAVLPRGVAMIEGDPRDGDDEWCIDDVDAEALARRVAAGKPALVAPWKGRRRR
ncbi:MAG: hypothetical protein KA297_07330 [Kofleriaceae bacterium]|nr:hypothetical protein [Kofleriaceae bacterium]MBP6836493.1 hypothetical protein [Kofleriaceae bacterium]